MELGEVVAVRSASSPPSTALLAWLAACSRERLSSSLELLSCVSSLLKVRLGAAAAAVAPDSAAAAGCGPVSLVNSLGAWSSSTAGAIQPCVGEGNRKLLAWLSIEVCRL